MRNAMDIATLSCSVVSKVDTAENILEDVRITFGVAAPVPYRCTETEALLKGRKLDASLYQKLEESVRSEDTSERFMESFQRFSSADWWRNCTESTEPYCGTCRKCKAAGR